MTIEYCVYSVLMLNKKVAGVRFQSSDGLVCDVEMEKLHGVKKSMLSDYRQDELIPHENLLVTEEELDGDVVVTDNSENNRYINTVLREVFGVGVDNPSALNPHRGVV